MLTISMLVIPLISALRVNVTRLQCGNTYDIIKEKEINLDYENFVMEPLKDCVINISCDDYGKMICIRNEGPYIDVDCSLHLHLLLSHNGKRKQHFNTSYPDEHIFKSRSCFSFMNKPQCYKTSDVSVVYRNHYNHDAKVNVKLYTKEYVEPPTRKPWSSWSSWSSSYDDNSYDDDDDDDESTGTVFGVVVGFFVTIVLTFCCVCANKTRSTSQEPRYAPTVQYRAQYGNQSMQQPRNYPNQTAGAQQFPLNQAGFQQPQRYMSDPPDYADCQTVFQQVPDRSNQAFLTTRQQSTDKPEEPAPYYEEPPPPYPGY